jgi:ribosomal protein S9
VRAALLDLSRSLEDHEQLVREVALAYDSLTTRDSDLVERVGQYGSRGRRKRREDGNRIDES